LFSDKIDGPNKKHGCSGKSKRVRTIFTPEQLERLEMEFERQQYMVGPERLYLAHTLQLTEAQVSTRQKNCPNRTFTLLSLNRTRTELFKYLLSNSNRTLKKSKIDIILLFYLKFIDTYII